MILGLDLLAVRPTLATSNLPALLTCFVVTATSCSLLHRLLPQRSLVPDRPGTGTSRVQRVGGLGLILGMTAGASLLLLSGQSVPWIALTCAGLLAIMGFMDDLSPQDPLLALTYQATLGAGMGWSHGDSARWLFVGAVLAPVVVGTTRLMDGVNALMGVTAVIWGITACWVGMAIGRADLALLGLLVVSATGGFLPFNTHGARLFLGDSGRYLLGGAFAAGIIGAFAWGWRAGILLVMPLAVHLVDVASTWMLERTHHRPRSRPHRERIYQRLVDEIGLSHPRVVQVVAAFSVVLTAVWFFAPWFLALPATLVLLALYIDLPRLCHLRTQGAGAPVADPVTQEAWEEALTRGAAAGAGATAQEPGTQQPPAETVDPQDTATPGASAHPRRS